MVHGDFWPARMPLTGSHGTSTAMPSVAMPIWANSGCLVMTSPSHQAAAAKMLAEINLMTGPAELNSLIVHAHESAANAVACNSPAFLGSPMLLSARRSALRVV